MTDVKVVQMVSMAENNLVLLDSEGRVWQGYQGHDGDRGEGRTWIWERVWLPKVPQ